MSLVAQPSSIRCIFYFILVQLSVLTFCLRDRSQRPQ
jgi:hypothetical protein